MSGTRRWQGYVKYSSVPLSEGSLRSVVVVTPAEPNDVPAIAGLLEELDRFYGASGFDPFEHRVEQITTLLFREVPAAYVLLARQDETQDAIGLAAYSFLWPAVGVTQSLYLKELYVAEAHRGGGIGRLLMTRLRDVAEARRCSRIEWTTDRDNDPARAFYERLGFEAESSKVFYRLTMHEGSVGELA